MRIFLYNNGTDVVWRIGYYDEWEYNYINSALHTNPSTDLWTCVEIRAVNGGEGEYQVWIDGEELTDLHLTGMGVYRNMDIVIIGPQILEYTEPAVTLHVDSVILGTEYIGTFDPEPPPIS